MKPIALTLLALSLACALPLAAQDDPPQDKPAERADAKAAQDTSAKSPAAAPQMSPDMQAMMAAWEKAATPGPQHKQLADQFVGTWNTKQTIWMDESTPPMTETGRSVATAVFGGRHVREEFSSQWMGQPFQGVALTSYDNIKGKYVSSWTDNMSTGQFLSEGDYDPATRTYTFRGQMPDPMKAGAMIPVRQVVRVLDNDRHVMQMHETRDGKERKTMEIEYTRAK